MRLKLSESCSEIGNKPTRPHRFLYHFLGSLLKRRQKMTRSDGSTNGGSNSTNPNDSSPDPESETELGSDSEDDHSTDPRNNGPDPESEMELGSEIDSNEDQEDKGWIDGAATSAFYSFPSSSSTTAPFPSSPRVNYY